MVLLCQSVNAPLVNLVQDLQKASLHYRSLPMYEDRVISLFYTRTPQHCSCIYTCMGDLIGWLLGWLSDTETAATPINTYLALACNANTVLPPCLRYLTICSAAKLSLFAHHPSKDDQPVFNIVALLASNPVCSAWARVLHHCWSDVMNIKVTSRDVCL